MNKNIITMVNELSFGYGALGFRHAELLMLREFQSQIILEDGLMPGMIVWRVLTDGLAPGDAPKIEDALVIAGINPYDALGTYVLTKNAQGQNGGFYISDAQNSLAKAVFTDFSEACAYHAAAVSAFDGDAFWQTDAKNWHMDFTLLERYYDLMNKDSESDQ